MESFNWSSGISLATLLGVVFFGGVFVQQLKGIAATLAVLTEKTVPRIHERLDSTDKWRAEHDGAERERRDRIVTNPNGRTTG
jgi:hypothetical protein